MLKASSRLLVLNLSPWPQMVRFVMNFDLIERVDSYDEISRVFQFSYAIDFRFRLVLIDITS